MSNEPVIETIRRNLVRLMDERGVKPTPLSLSIGTNRTAVGDILARSDNVGIGMLEKLAKALDVDVADIVSESTVPLSGRVEQAGFLPFADSDPPHYAPRPLGLFANLGAAIVKGAALFPRFRDGDLIYWSQTERRPADHLGEDCLVKQVTGEIHVRQLLSGSQPLRYTLRTPALTDLDNVELFWVKPIVFMVPAAVARMVGDRINPTFDLTRL